MVRKMQFPFIVATLLMLLVIGMVGCSTPAAPERGAPALTAVTLNLNWLPEDPPYWVALDKGFWAEQQLDVKIIRGYGSGDTVAKIASKQAEFGLADFGAVVLGRAQEDMKIKVVANHLTGFPGVIVYRGSRGIKVPKDLEGKTIVSSPASSFRLFWPAFAKAVGIDESKVKWQLVEPSLQQVVYVQGGVDAWTSDIENIPAVEELTGEPVQFFSYKDDAGLDRYGESLIVHEDTLVQNPDLVRRFVLGYLQGVRYALENPAEVSKIVQKYVPEVDADLTRATWEATVKHELVVSEESREKGLGWMSRERVASTIQLVLDAYELEAELLPETVFTTDFLPAEPVYPPGN